MHLTTETGVLSVFPENMARYNVDGTSEPRIMRPSHTLAVLRALRGGRSARTGLLACSGSPARGWHRGALSAQGMNA